MDTESLEYKQGRKRANANGISPATYRARVVIYNWGIERACTEKPANTTALAKLCKKHGIRRSQYDYWKKQLPEGTKPKDIAEVAKVKNENGAGDKIPEADLKAIREKLTKYNDLIRQAKAVSPVVLAEEYGVSIGTVYRQMETSK